MSDVLPAALTDWFTQKGWQPHAHQLQVMEARGNPACLLIAPTGCGKTLAGFLPSLADLAQAPHAGLHTLYVSPLKALAADIKRNLRGPAEEMGLDIRIEDRTGDTSATQKRRQRADPPQILLTTPESLALLTSYSDAERIFSGLKRVVIDEVHALSESKRGDQLMLSLAALQHMCPDMQRIGLSATVQDPEEIAGFLACHPAPCHIIQAPPGPLPDIAMLQIDAPAPWSGGGAGYAIPQVLREVAQHNTVLIFHNTRAQAEIFFHKLWQLNEDNLPIAIHHGSLSRAQRERVEAAMVAGALRAIVCTGSLDLGLDWGNVDLVIQVGAPKNVKRLVQRIGRANHRYNSPSKARLVPANRFEVVECVAALQAVRANDLDGEPMGPGPRDVLCQHILIAACAGPFHADDLYRQITTAGRYAQLARAEFDACLEFCATGGYALKAYDRWRRLRQTADGKWQLRDPRAAQRIRMNIGTIQDSDRLKVRLRGRGGRALGEVEEAFAATLEPGDSFLIGGQVVRYEGLRDLTVEVTKQPGKKPKIATFSGTKFATSTQLSQRILAGFQQKDWPELPGYMRDWIALQRHVSLLPRADRLLVESFPHEGRFATVVYGFAGRNALQTLGLLLSKRMEEARLAPLSFVATDYAVMLLSLEPLGDAAGLLAPAGLRDGLERWLAGNAVMKRSFRGCAVIAGLIERNMPGQRKSGRQATFSSDILYDTLLKYDPNHVLMQITREEARRGLVDFDRIEEMLARCAGRLDHKELDRLSPFAAPLFLEMGRVPVQGAAQERLLAEETARLMEASGLNKITLAPLQ